MVKIVLIRYLLSKSILSERLAKWSLQLVEFGITCLMPSRIKGQAVINMITLFLSEDVCLTMEEILGELPK